jgi:hypothetical protein
VLNNQTNITPPASSSASLPIFPHFSSLFHYHPPPWPRLCIELNYHMNRLSRLGRWFAAARFTWQQRLRRCKIVYLNIKSVMHRTRVYPKVSGPAAWSKNSKCSCIAILWVSLVSFAATTLCVASQWVFVVIAYFVIDSVRKRLDTSSYISYKSRDSSVGIALSYRLDDRGPRVRFPAEGGNFSLHHRVQNGSEAHPASYPMGTRGSFPGSKTAGAWSWPLTSIYTRGQRMSGAMPPLPQYAFMAWCLVKYRDNFTFYLYNVL